MLSNYADIATAQRMTNCILLVIVDIFVAAVSVSGPHRCSVPDPDMTSASTDLRAHLRSAKRQPGLSNEWSQEVYMSAFYRTITSGVFYLLNVH